MTTAIATEQGHWYDAATGEPRYTITGKNGKERNTTLRDARKENYVPSVTAICRTLAAPGLSKWKEKQILLAALTLPRIAGETDDAFAERVIADSEAQSKAAREAGTELHGDIEKRFEGRGGDPKWEKHFDLMRSELHETYIDVTLGKAERSFAHSLGFGGKVDWHNDSTVIDFKTKDKITDDKKLAYDEHCYQLAAYALGLGLVAPRCINVFIGVTDGKVVIHEWNAVEIARGERIFRALLAVWQEVNDFPAKAPAPA